MRAYLAIGNLCLSGSGTSWLSELYARRVFLLAGAVKQSGSIAEPAPLDESLHNAGLPTALLNKLLDNGSI